MKIRELIISTLFALILAITLCIVINGPENFNFNQILETRTPDLIPTSEEPLIQSTEQSTSPPNSLSSVSGAETYIGRMRGMDLADVLLLYDSTRETIFDINFCKIAEYYGLVCKRIALNTTILTDELLRDEDGNYLNLIGMSTGTFLTYPAPLNNDELVILRSAIERGGVHLLLSKIHGVIDSNLLVTITDGIVQGFSRPQDTKKDWIISSELPQITREFTGVVISSESEEAQQDFAVLYNQTSRAKPVILSTDDEGNFYPIFIQLALGDGSILIDAGDDGWSLEEVPLWELYYQMDSEDRGFTQIIPLMLSIRYAFGEETWHTDHKFANLTMDGSTLLESVGNLNYSDLFLEMKTHDFHTAIAMPPVEWNKSRSEVIDLFRENPQYYSIVQYGNNGDEYEFYKYEVTEDEEEEGTQFPETTFIDQEADILEGLSRMTELMMTTGISCDRVMVFPGGISPEPTLVLLKKYNFLATVNEEDVPLDAIRPSDWDYGMYPANLHYGNFATLTRRPPGTFQPFEPMFQPFIFNLFIGKPALFYSHPFYGGIFHEGIDAFSPLADQINQLTGEVEWQSLGYILQHLYLKKINDDGSIDIKMYTNHLILTNDDPKDLTYHISKEENANVPISRLTLNGQIFPYTIEGNVLTIDAVVPGNSTVEIRITYDHSTHISIPQ